MQAIITESLELVLRWRDNGESTVEFALASDSEFLITVSVFSSKFLNYQGDLTVKFQTMCYGQDLFQFQNELLKMVNGQATSARFVNTGEDFEIRITQHDSGGQRTMLSELRYRHHRDQGDIFYPGELTLPVGMAEELVETSKAINEIIRILKVDCRSLFDLPR